MYKDTYRTWQIDRGETGAGVLSGNLVSNLTVNVQLDEAGIGLKDDCQ